MQNDLVGDFELFQVILFPSIIATVFYFYSFIHVFNKYLLHIYSVSGIILSVENMLVIQTEEIAFMRLTF
jgi:hypothetical protein